MRESGPPRPERPSVKELQRLERQAVLMEGIGDVGLKEVDDTFGTGYPHFEGKSERWPYHNGYHARQVRDGGAVAATILGYDNKYDQVFVRQYGKIHDLRQGGGRGVDERATAAWIMGQMEEQGMPRDRIIEAGLVIVGTEPILDEKFNLIGQKVTELDFPNKRAKDLAESVASGDTCNLFQPEGPLLAHELLREFKKGAEPTMKDVADFQKVQIALLNRYQFPIEDRRKREEFERKWSPLRAKSIAHQEKILSLIERGDITTFDQVVQMDLEFLHHWKRQLG